MDRQALRAALLATEPWLAAADLGPQAVTAGMCDRCGERPRLLPTCGPAGHEALCPACAEDRGDDAWCDGHLAEGRAARRWASRLPERWADAAVLWWVATGEIRLAPGERPDASTLAPQVAQALTLGP